MSDCPCAHEEAEHGTYGCLSGWRWEGEHLLRGCECKRRRAERARMRTLPVFGLPFPKADVG